ncbi:Threonylcarbamoyl-AMP synthase [Trichinella spiralis]|uniref:Threonylcarbamoyl-AMP synthase n=1 Tax=Trichinella spiralis TaxID=6334 RepID=A0ABR3K108_TRISP
MQPGQNAETPPPRCSNDSFFILIPPANAETDHRYRHFGGSELVRTEHPVPNPVLSRTDACFSRTTTSGWIWNPRDRATSASPTLSIQKRSGAIFDLIDQSGGSNVGPLSRSWQPRSTKSRPFQRNIPIPQQKQSGKNCQTIRTTGHFESFELCQRLASESGQTSAATNSICSFPNETIFQEKIFTTKSQSEQRSGK